MIHLPCHVANFCEMFPQPMGIASLMICLVGGSIYKQAPMRAMSKPQDRKTLIPNEDGVWDDAVSHMSPDEELESLVVAVPNTPSGAASDKSGIQRRA